MNQAKSILHVTVGHPDWEPTEIELADLQRMFEEAVASDAPCSVVTTRAGVYLEIVSLNPVTDVDSAEVPQINQSFDPATGAQLFEFRQRSSCCDDDGGCL